MIARPFPHVAMLVTVLSSCGRIGYDEIVGLDGPGSRAPVESGGAGPSLDSGSSVGSAGASSGTSGDASNGGTDGRGSGGALGNGGLAGSGAVGNGGAATSGGAGPSGGAAGDAGVRSGGVASTGGATGGGAPFSGGTPGGGGTPSAGGSPSSGGAGGAAVIGCADGQREGFLDVVTYPDIAACDGGFTVPGTVGLTGPACGRAAGDDTANPSGTGCNVEDLCESGFHVCTGAAEVGTKSSTGCTAAEVGTASLFYLTLQSGPGQQKCGAGTDDVFGCGTIGYRPSTGCTPLDRASGNLCSALVAPWTCGTNQTGEALNVSKPGAAAGGVLCCRD